MIRVIDSPIGHLTLVATDAGLARINFAHQELTDAPTTGTGNPAVVEQAERQLYEYFEGKRYTFDISLDRSCSSSFALPVHEAMQQVGFGETTSYKALAEAIGRPQAARAVGTACGANPLPIIVPCHRVLRSDGGLGGYAGGLAAKEYLLALEQAPTSG